MKLKKILSVLLLFFIFLSSFSFSGKTVSSYDFSVSIISPEKAEPGEIITVTINVINISCDDSEEAKGILGTSIFLYYDWEFLTPVQDSFEPTVPSGWDSFDGTATQGIWGLYSVFDGNLNNGAINDGEVSFKVSFYISEAAMPGDTYLYVNNCEGTRYANVSNAPITSFTSTAYCAQKLIITEPRLLIPREGISMEIDRENYIIYSHIPSLTFNDFYNLFSYIDGDLTIFAFDYEVTSENEKYIPNGATVSVYHYQSGKTFSFTYYLLGDCDCNGKVSITDLAYVKAVIVNRIPIEGYVKYAMEFEDDGVIRIADYIRLKLYISKQKIV